MEIVLKKIKKNSKKKNNKLILKAQQRFKSICMFLLKK